MRATLRDIAARAGVTKATVSYAMSGKPKVSEEMRARILEIARELGYQPNVTARALSVGRSPTLALMVENIANPFYPEFALEVERAARVREHFLLICNTDADPDIGRDYLRRIAAGLSEGIVAMAGHLRIEDVIEVNRSGVPVVVCMWEEPETAPLAPCVTVDLAQAGAIAAEHLLALGHRSIGVLVDGDEHELHHQRRLGGFIRATREAGVTIDARHIVRASDTIAGGTHAARTLLAAAPSLTALFATNDLLALGALRAAHEKGIRIPQQLSVIGITDIRAASESYPALTTVALQTREVAAQAVGLLIDLIEGTVSPDPPPLIIVPSPPELKVRESTAPPRRSS
jgi:DNA-binding LacI/PurR family transcriptional regulator